MSDVQYEKIIDAVENVPMKITVKILGRYKDITGKDHIIFDVKEGDTLRDLINIFVKLYPATEIDKSRMMVSKNKMYVSYDTKINEGDEVSLCPPVVSGG
jgi:MoaD family protein